MKKLLLFLWICISPLCAQDEPAQEPAVKAVAKTLPAVVNINTESVVRHQVRDPMDSFFDDYFGRQMRPPRLIKQKVQSLGSGFLVDASGYILTNAHVVDRAAEMKISVTTNDGKTYTATYITGDPEIDLALIKIESKTPLPFIPLTELSPNLLGQTCLVLGNPLGYGSSVARGILSAKGRSVTVGENEYQNLLQTDAAINPGNSGGPVVDIAGKLVGISSVKMSFTPQGVPTQGLGFAIPANIAREKLEEFKKIARGEKVPEKPGLAKKYFGLTLQNIDAKAAEKSGYAEGSGVLVAEVEPKSAAALAGIEPGMLITTVGRYDVNEVRTVEKLLGHIDSGNRVDFGIQWHARGARGTKTFTDTIRLVAR
ncbi:MAG: Serine protease Do [Verrucomicrobiota bacterium]|jgi:serine protease Do